MNGRLTGDWKTLQSNRLVGLTLLCCESARESSFHPGTAAVEITAPRGAVFAFVFLPFSLSGFLIRFICFSSSALSFSI